MSEPNENHRTNACERLHSQPERRRWVDFIELSIGGTLSLGGIGSQSFRFGPQVDNVLELQVVTGAGDL